MILDDIGNNLVNEIKRRFSEKGLNDTSSTVNSLRFEASENNLTVFGSGVIEWLNRGRHPGGKLPYDGRKSYLLEWVKRKFNPSTESEARGLAYIIGKRLQERGSRIYRNRQDGLELEEVIEMGVNQIKREYTASVIKNINSDIIKSLRTI